MAAALIVTSAAAALTAAQVPVAPTADASGVQGLPAVLPGTVLPLPEAPPDTLWSVPIAAAPITSPLIAGEYVLISHLPGIVAAHRVADGQHVWQRELNPEQPMVADGGMLIVASGEAIHALRIADGVMAWRASSGKLSAPLLAQDGWVVAAGAGKLTARRTTDGSIVWSVDAPLQREAAAISGNTLAVPGVDGRLRMVDLATGAVTWERRLDGSPGPPLVLGDSIFLGASDKYFYCIDAGSGEIEWKFRVGASIRGRAASDGEHVYFTALDNLVRALNFDNGAQRWQTGLAFRPLAGPIVAGGTVFISGSGNEVRMLRAATGGGGGSVTFPARLAVAPGLLESPYGVAISAITGGLDESWSLLLTRPVRLPPLIGPAAR
jgi:glucose dehydrogenase